MKTRTWTLISLACALGAILCWLLGNERAARQSGSAATNAAGATSRADRLAPPVRLLTRVPAAAPDTAGGASAGVSSAGLARVEPVDPVRPLRLRNTAARLDALVRSETAVLLENALIDTAAGPAPAVPEPLRSAGDPGSYVVQSRGMITPAFRALLAAQGAAIVSYLPNNAFLVRAGAAEAAMLASSPLTAAVLPFEPYYKLQGELLSLAVEQQPLEAGARLMVTAFPGEGERVAAAVGALGGRVCGQGRSPFGPQYVVEPGTADWVALALLPEVQLVEAHADRVMANDLTRVRVGVAEDATNTANYFGLTGSNVWVNVNDTGIDAQHPDLLGRVFGDTPLTLTDTNGHGTHVAGTIAGSGEHSPTVTNVVGSPTNANFRGIAPAAQLFALPVDLVLGPLQSDAYLQETAARTNYGVLGRTNALISNNSWGYLRQFDYTSAAASYDAAVRDAVPEMQGPQAMAYVFAAGNHGAGNDIGTGGEPGSIVSPATAKNVITVGAIDSPRAIAYDIVLTNQVTNIVEDEFVVTNVTETNKVYLGEADSSDEVTAFSSRGNVGIGQESETGRFKPDVVAPGAFVISTRSTGWDVSRLLTNAVVEVYPEQLVSPDEWNRYSITVPTNAIRLVIETLPDAASPSPFPPLAIYARLGDFPAAADFVAETNAVVTTNGVPALEPGTWYYSVGNPTNLPVSYTLRTTLEVSVGLDSLMATLTNINEALAPDYRYDSGTSASAAAVSGLLALVQEYFEQQLQRPYSPALLKALLISGARSLGPQYNYQVQNHINYQGWGLAQLPTMLPGSLTNSTDEATWPIRWIDQSPTNALATGESHRYELGLPEDVGLADLRVTLVWTDPPGNPAASVKLVNDLDLVVSNAVTGEVYAGNQFPAGSDYTELTGTNAAPDFDRVNNVENVILRQPAATNYVIEVMGRRVNVNAVTAHTNGIVQDYALVVSLGSTNAISLRQVAATNALPVVPDNVTNGVPMLQQRVGANSPLQAYPVGTTNQWHFYVFTNIQQPEVTLLTNGQYVFFATFVPPNLSVPRNEESDIDLYVARNDDRLLQLDPAALAGAYRSVLRGGTEVVSFTNSTLGEVFYIGVKSEDQMAAEYGFVGISTDTPFETIDPYGNHLLQGLPPRVPIPDGSPVTPGHVLQFAVGITPIEVGRAVVATGIAHERPGDVWVNLDHYSDWAVLLNHNDGDGEPPGWVGGLFDDTGGGRNIDSVPTDGPGSLNNFIGNEGAGLWMMTTVDNTLGHTGYVENLVIRLEPNPDLLMGVAGTVLANQFNYYFFDVPADASRFTVVLSSMTGPLNLYLRWEALPTLTEYDHYRAIAAPGGSLSITPTSTPPLTPGRYYIGLYNPTANPVDYFLQVRLERDLSAAYRRSYTTTNVTVIGDDVLTLSTNAVDETRTITDARVGLRIGHERLSDLDVYVVNPQGERVLVNESRGGTNRTQYGFDQRFTNYHHVALTYATNSGVAALYLDGNLLIERDVGRSVWQTAYDLFLGYKPATNGTATQYLGGLDEVEVYGRALAASEIRALYKYGGAGRPTNDLISLWPFEGSGEDVLSNHVAWVDGPAYEAGRFGQGLQFVNPGSRVQVTNSPLLDLGRTPGFTLDAWINPADLTVERPLAVWSDGTNAAGLEWYLQPGSDTNRAWGLLSARFVSVAGVTNELVGQPQGLIQTNGILTNVMYTTFTEDTNLAFVPIKFGDPATNLSLTATNRLVSGFEPMLALPRTNLTAGQAIEGWQVLTGQVTVLWAPPIAHTGTNLLVLGDGRMEMTLPTVAGRIYRLQFVSRTQPQPGEMVSWWAAERDTQDLMGTNHGSEVGSVAYGGGWVGDAFQFAAGGGYVEVPASGTLDFTNEATVEFWFRPWTVGGAPLGVLSRGTAGGAANYGVSVSAQGLSWWFNDPTTSSPLSDDGSGLELARLAEVPALGRFHHFAGTLKQVSDTQVELQMYLDGVLRRSKVLPGVLSNAVTGEPLLLGRLAPGDPAFEGDLDEVSVYRRVLTGGEIGELYWMNTVGKARPPRLAQSRVVIDNVSSNTFTAGAEWATNSILFQAATDGTPLRLESVARGALFDSFELQEQAATYFLAEESLKPLIGQSGIGEWRLEVVDRRTGATNAIDPELLSWQLELTFAPLRIPFVRLTNGVPYASRLPNGQARYFAVDVPRIATQATNTLLSAAGLDLWYNAATLPGVHPGVGSDEWLLANATAMTTMVATNGTTQVDTNGVAQTPLSLVPQLQPGQTYYLMVTNPGPIQDFSLQVDFDALDTNVTGLTLLGFGETVTTNLVVTNALQYYRYDVTTNAVAATFEVHPADGNVQLYIRKAQPVPAPLPTPWVYDYASENPGTNAEIILVTQDSLVPLGSGPWYLGVLNVDTNDVDYAIRVVEYTDPLAGVIRLAEGVAVAGQVGAGGLADDYVFTCSNDPPAVQFDLFNLSANASLAVQLNRRAVPDDALVWDPGTPEAPARITLRTNDALPSLNGDWFLAVASDEPAGSPDVTYSVRAVYPPATVPVIDLAAGVAVTGTLAADTFGAARVPDYYRFPVGDTVTNLEVVLTPVDGNVDLVLRRLLPLPDWYQFDYLGVNPDLTPEYLYLDASSAPVPLAPGDWYLGIYNQTMNSATYRLRVRAAGSGGAGGWVINPAVVASDGAVTFTWDAAPGEMFQVQYATSIPAEGAILWETVPGVVGSGSGRFSFVDDGTQTGGITPFKIYRLVAIRP